MTELNEWDAREQIATASKAGRHDDAVEAGELALEAMPDSEVIATALGWALYRRDIAHLDDETGLPLRRAGKAALDRIASLTTADPYGDYSPFPLSTLRFARVLTGRFDRAALEILDRLDVTRLSTRSDNGYSSMASQFHAVRTKLLRSLERWEDLDRATAAALEGHAVSDDDRVWIRHRAGLAALHLDRPDDAAEHFSATAQHHDEWWVARDRAAAELARDDAATAVRLVAPWLLSGLNDPFRVGLLSLSARAFADADDPTTATALVAQTRALRRAKGWPADTELEALATRLDVADEAEPRLADVRAACEALLEAEATRGTVVRRTERGFGFISPDHGGDEVFVHASDCVAGEVPDVGTAVTYRLVDSLNRSTGRPSTKAAGVRVS